MSRRKSILWLVIAGGLVFCGVYGAFRFVYPFGPRTCFLPCMNNALQTYANANSGVFPDGPDSYAALRKLYPLHMPNADLLAGISGNVKATRAILQTNGLLTSNECSWVYLKGLNSSNPPKTILIYERRTGVYVNGFRKNGRAVGFVDGSASQMDEQAFQRLLVEQQRSRTERKSP